MRHAPPLAAREKTPSDIHPAPADLDRPFDRLKRGSGASAPTLDPRTLPVYDVYRRLRREMLTLERPMSSDELVVRLLEAVVEVSAGESRIIAGGRVYRRTSGGYRLIAKAGDGGPAQLGYLVPAGYGLIQELLRRGWVVAGHGDPRLDASIEGPIGASSFAAIVVGDAEDYLLSLTLRESITEDDAKLALASLASIADTALRQQAMLGSLGQAKQIQTSLLPASPPEFPGYEIAVRSSPAELVGGDVYDFHRTYGEGLGVCLGDACGHGLPAALQARDLIVGLRMAVEQNLKLVKTIDSLDRVMRRGSVAGRFISVFYAEIDPDGTVIYINAGHVPAILLRRAGCGVQLLESSGPVLGLGLGEGRGFHRSFARLEPGDTLVLYTDGITETLGEDGEELGHDGLVELVCRHRDRPASEVIDLVFQELETLDAGPQADDRTLLVIRRELEPA